MLPRPLGSREVSGGMGEAFWDWGRWERVEGRIHGGEAVQEKVGPTEMGLDPQDPESSTL